MGMTTSSGEGKGFSWGAGLASVFSFAAGAAADCAWSEQAENKKVQDSNASSREFFKAVLFYKTFYRTHELIERAKQSSERKPAAGAESRRRRGGPSMSGLCRAW